MGLIRASLLGTLLFLSGAQAQNPSYADESSGGIHVSMIDGPQTPGEAADLEITQSRRALSLIKNRLGAKEMLNLLKPEIEASDEFWLSIVQASTETPVPAFVHLDIAVDSSMLDANTFLAWLGADIGNPMRLIGANPEEYIKTRVASHNTTNFEITKSLGGFITHFMMLDFGAGKKKPFMADLPLFPIQSVAQFKLRCGTAFADFHLALRDKADRTGMEAAIYLWFPGETPSQVIEAVREHIAVTFTNYFSMAYRDIAYGRFKLP